MSRDMSLCARKDLTFQAVANHKRAVGLKYSKALRSDDCRGPGITEEDIDKRKVRSF